MVLFMRLDDKFKDQSTEEFKKVIKEKWQESQTQFDFAMTCYMRGRIDEARLREPQLNSVIMLIETNKNEVEKW
jgi:hypothetical protein